ncbi:DUF2272 domain-containing protein [Noviherbaspirillum aerium]|uniref:DUF2272 domain-containing protein n=1 Tax=Noviherbaspirillum aerium TaxID=2588497 RepID=UPI00178C31D2|nr:DUF2272 domain-containing protein [Noviherbaspirillum aerium]
MRYPSILPILRFTAAVILAPIFTGANAHARACPHSGPPSAMAMRLAAVADREYREFNGHRIDDDGTLLRFGSMESESELLHDPDTGASARDRPGRYAWRRVWEYWVALGEHVHGEPWHRKLIFVPGLLDDAHSSARAKERELASLLPDAAAEGEGEAQSALRQALVRAALNDSPWSAAFISYLMHQAGLSDAQFRYSATHSDYIKAAFADDPAYAYRACDPALTRPRIGDLLCYSRGNRPLRRFADWQEAVRGEHFITASHCEVVVDVNRSARKIDTVGGNVLQSVARRKLRLNEAEVLSGNHSPLQFEPEDETACLVRKKCRRQNVNLQYWSVLLQLK